MEETDKLVWIISGVGIFTVQLILGFAGLFLCGYLYWCFSPSEYWRRRYKRILFRSTIPIILGSIPTGLSFALITVSPALGIGIIFGTFIWLFVLIFAVQHSRYLAGEEERENDPVTSAIERLTQRAIAQKKDGGEL